VVGRVALPNLLKSGITDLTGTRSEIPQRIHIDPY
jgi:hypothetical protein